MSYFHFSSCVENSLPLRPQISLLEKENQEMRQQLARQTGVDPSRIRPGRQVCVCVCVCVHTCIRACVPELDSSHSWVQYNLDFECQESKYIRGISETFPETVPRLYPNLNLNLTHRFRTRKLYVPRLHCPGCFSNMPKKKHV